RCHHFVPLRKKFRVYVIRPRQQHSRGNRECECWNERRRREELVPAKRRPEKPQIISDRTKIDELLLFGWRLFHFLVRNGEGFSRSSRGRRDRRRGRHMSRWRYPFDTHRPSGLHSRKRTLVLERTLRRLGLAFGRVPIESCRRGGFIRPARQTSQRIV